MNGFFRNLKNDCVTKAECENPTEINIEPLDPIPLPVDSTEIKPYVDITDSTMQFFDLSFQPAIGKNLLFLAPSTFI